MSDELYRNAALPVEARIDDLLPRLNLSEKLVQLRNLVAVNFDTSTDYAVCKGDELEMTPQLAEVVETVGSLQCLTRCDFWTKRNRDSGYTPERIARFTARVQQYAISHNRWGIPLLLFDDCRHGLPAPGATVFPTGITQACAWNPDLQRRIGRAVGAEMHAAGIQVSVGPNLNLARDPRWSRMEECYGEDPWLAGKLGEAYIQGLQTDYQAAACMHFIAGMGETENGLDGRPISMGERQLQELFRPFGWGARAGALAGMVSYSSIDGVPCHANRKLLTGLLRDQYGFRGCLESDAIGVFDLKSRHRLSEDEVETVAAAIRAGLNLDLYMTGFLRYTDALVEQALERGLLVMDDIDRLVRDVLRVKFTLGLFESAAAPAPEAWQPHPELALEAARQSVILLKNTDATLPLDARKIRQVAVIGPHADDVYNQLGDYTGFQERSAISTLFDGIRREAPPEVTVTCVRGCGVKDNDQSGFAAALAIAQDADVIIMTIGGSSNRYGQEFNTVGGGTGGIQGDADCGEGLDRATLEPLGAQLALWERLRQLDKPLIAALIHGRPLVIESVIATADAIVDLWYPGEAGGQAFGEMLWGKFSPAGRLPISIPRHAGQLPIYYNTLRPVRQDYIDLAATPAFSFGYGLSYTTFTYSALQVTPEQITAAGSAEVTVTVTNSGTRDSDEVVQLYVGDDYSSVVRPERELRGFQRIHLRAGESQVVRFHLSFEELACWDGDGKWTVEPGSFTIAIGAKCATLRVITN